MPVIARGLREAAGVVVVVGGLIVGALLVAAGAVEDRWGQ
jgi:hypothetical protein